MSKPKSLRESLLELGEACRELLLVVAKEMRIIALLDWLAAVLSRTKRKGKTSSPEADFEQLEGDA